MKRFYCTECKRTVRTHRLPDNVQLQQGPKGPVYGEGRCRWHDEVPQPPPARPTVKPQVLRVTTTSKRK